MKIVGRYTQVSDTSHGCDHADLAVVVDGECQQIECTRCKKRWDSILRCALCDACSALCQAPDWTSGGFAWMCCDEGACALRVQKGGS